MTIKLSFQQQVNFYEMKVPHFGIVLSICKVQHKEQGRKRSIPVRFGDVLILSMGLIVNKMGSGEFLALFRIKFGEGRQIINAGKNIYYIR